ncbi:radical SAM family heme chaperone HemW [uncultured Pseudosulfitobacter sp.]|uniref:radical SAM family heme chaperone HemW n=1 Tax=uncultured Pseudosulfitobacter sp. TaxID=2854214 RepID=UPI0030D8EB01
MTDDWQNGGFGIYIHWPFCAAKCPYCDFNSHVVRSIDHAAWRDAYLDEIRKAAEQTPGRVVHTVFFGGGTPSLMEPWVVADIIDAIRKHWPTANDMEITLEANPGSVEAQRFADFRSGGVNRISMGIQALNDADLRRLGRIHSADEARAAFDIARKTFDRVSFDLIYGRQKQTLAEWEAELKQALNMAIDHLSLYQLTIEQGTAFGDRYNAGKLAGLPDEDRAADMFTLTRDICADFGMPAYEVSNHARDGAQSRHNLIYWRYGDYVGIGPGAHGRLTIDGQRFATEAPSNPKRWLEELRQLPNVALTGEDQANEFLLMGLRLTEGVDLSRFQALSGRPVAPDTLKNLSDLGLLDQRDQRISVTEQGVSVLNGVLRELLAD